MVRYLGFVPLFMVLMCLPLIGSAQEDACTILVDMALKTVGENCSGLGRNQACYGNGDVTALDFDSDPVADFEDSGDTADVTTIGTLTTAPMDVDTDIWGIALLALQADLPGTLPGQNVTFVVFGDAELTNEIAPVDQAQPPPTMGATATGAINVRGGPGTEYGIVMALAAGDEVTLTGRNETGDWVQFSGEDGPAWVYAPLLTIDEDAMLLWVVEAGADMPSRFTTPMQAFRLKTGIGEPICEEAPQDGLLVQAPTDTTVHFRINGVDVEVASTALLQLEDEVLGVNTFDGSVRVTSAGEMQTAEPGFRVNATVGTPPTEPEPYDYDQLRNVPVVLLPDAVNIPIVIPPTILWLDTGIQLEAGQTFTITATGAWDQTQHCQAGVDDGTLEGSYEDCLATAPQSPAGHPGGLTGNMLGHPPIWPLMDVPMGALIGRIGDGDAFGILEGGTFTATDSGNLYLGNNLPDPQLLHEGAYIAIVEVDQ